MAVEGSDRDWWQLYRTGAVSAAVFVLLVLVPIILVVAAPVPPVKGRALLEYVAEHRVVYLVELVCFVGLAVPALLVFAAVAVAARRISPSLALVGGLFGVGSEIVALAVGSSPQSLHGGIVSLSDAYVATPDAERDSLVAAADALVAIANSMPWAGILTAAGILVLSWVIRRGPFGRALGWFGVVVGVLGILSEALRPLIGAAYFLYGLALPVWFGWVGWKLYRLTRR
jgi:hypothetical protein